MATLDPTDPAVWRQVQRTLARTQRSSLHCAIASISADGHPHVSPIGSLRLGEPAKGTYLDVFNVQLGRNIDQDPRITVLAVDSSPTTWLRGLVEGRFPNPPGVRLVGTASPSRPATQQEIDRFRRSVRPTLLTKGGRALFGQVGRVKTRDLTFTGVIPVRASTLTSHLWRFGDNDASHEEAVRSR